MDLRGVRRGIGASPFPRANVGRKSAYCCGAPARGLLEGEAMAVIGFFVRPWRGMTLWRSLAWQALDFPHWPRRRLQHHGSCRTEYRPRRDLRHRHPTGVVHLPGGCPARPDRRSRAAALLGVNLASPHAPFVPGNWWNRLRQQVTTASRWREIGYLSLGLPIQGVMGVAALVLWSGPSPWRRFRSM